MFLILVLPFIIVDTINARDLFKYNYIRKHLSYVFGAFRKKKKRQKKKEEKTKQNKNKGTKKGKKRENIWQRFLTRIGIDYLIA